MRLIVSPQISSNFAGLSIGVVSVIGSNNRIEDPAIIALVKKQEDLLRESLDEKKLSGYPFINNWRQAYRQFGVNPKKRLSSVENLAKRVLGGASLRSINPFVDLYNYISLKYLIPVGGEDLDAVVGDIQLTYATADEKPVVLLGEKEAKAPQEGEVIYKDSNGAICRRWNWKEADRTKLTPESTNAVFVLEGLPPVDPKVIKASTTELAQLIKKYCGGDVTTAFIEGGSPEVALKEDGEFVRLQPVAQGIPSLEIYEQQTVVDQEEQGEHALRKQKVETMRGQGIEPWPSFEPVTATCAEVIDDYEAREESNVYAIAGRIMSMRLHGKTAFMHLQDRSGRVQVYIKRDVVGDEAFSFLKAMVDIGDILWCKGFSFRTQTGEVTLEVEQFKLVSKSLYPLPEKFHGLTDQETKYRQRYLDLIANPETRDRFIKRSQIIKIMRSYLDSHGFIEVETPMLHPIAGGAVARPFITHHNALNQDLYLRIAPELYLKRLVVGGLERVYEINRNFRNEGISTKHNPEFTMLEFYMAYQDYHYIMGFVEEMLRKAVREVCETMTVEYEGNTIDFGEPFLRLPMRESLITHGGLTEADITPESIGATAKKLGVEMPSGASFGEHIASLFEHCVESKLIQPTFITHFPIEISPLSKRDSEDPTIAARFELFIAGMEISNGFNELNDPFDQAQRFRDQVAAHKAGDEEAHQYDADYVHALEYALPPTVGVGIGIDRFTMLLTSTPSIKEVILFPTLKRKG